MHFLAYSMWHVFGIVNVYEVILVEGLGKGEMGTTREDECTLAVRLTKLAVKCAREGGGLHNAIIDKGITEE